ncbi:hypothetical protein Dfri01_10090 [Dyadobacter frigoris]|nr:hypothetical protein Dfri01_10090 [Dyadobacter frigoris]
MFDASEARKYDGFAEFEYRTFAAKLRDQHPTIILKISNQTLLEKVSHKINERLNIYIKD